MRPLFVLFTFLPMLLLGQGWTVLSSNNASNIFFASFNSSDSAGNYLRFNATGLANVVLSKVVVGMFLPESVRVRTKTPLSNKEPIRLAFAVDSAGAKLITTSFVYGATKENVATVPFLSRAMGGQTINRILIAVSNMNVTSETMAVIWRGVDLYVGGSWITIDSVGMTGIANIGAPALISPANNAVNVNLNVNFSCFPIIGANGYKFYISVQGYPDPIVLTSSSPQVNISLPPQKIVQWYAIGTVNGVEGPPSLTWAFSTSSTLTEVEKNTLQPETFGLAQNYPNPFNPTTKIRFGLEKAGYAELKVYDLLGREMKTLVSSEFASGFHEVEFNAANLSSGTYIYRLSSGGKQQVRRMVVNK